MYSKLITLISAIAPLAEHEVDLVRNSFKPLYLKKGEFFLQAGQINRHIGFLGKGLVRYFVYNKDEESTFEFTKAGEFVADYQSFNSRRPSVQNIQAIEDCELLVMTYDDLQQIFSRVKNGNLIGRLIVEHRFDVMVTQLLAIYMQTHEERYKSFIALYSDLSQRIPQYLIASYVGVKPPSLSRIRRRFAKDAS